MAPKKRKEYVGDGNVEQVMSPQDYGIVPGRGAALSVARGKKPKGTTGVGDLTLYGTNIVGNGVNTSTLIGPDGKPVTPVGKGLPDPTRPGAASNFLTPEEQEQARNALTTAGEVEAAAPKDKPWFATLFDTSDTFDENGNFKSGDLAALGGEAVFDGFLRGLQWVFDRTNQITVAGLSGLPGGTRTLTWDEANEVSFGQMLVANAGISAGRVRRGEANVGDALALAFGIVPGIGAAVAAINDPTTPIQQKGWDIMDEKDREVFNNGAERFFSGAGDFGFAFADPTLIAGWGGKVARLRYVDQLIDTPQKLQASVDRVVDGKRILENNLPLPTGVADEVRPTIERSIANVDELELAPEAMFLYNAVKQTPEGKKITSWEEIYNHKVIRYAGNRDALATALYNANDYDEASLVLRHAWGDKNALPELLQKRPEVLGELIDGERELLRLTFESDPKKQADMIAGLQSRIDRYDRDLEFLRTNGADDPRLTEKLNFVISKKNQILDDLAAINRGEIPTPISAADKELISESIKRLQARDLNLDTTIRAAATAGGSLVGGTKGFSRAGKFGRAVEKSRQKRARAQYETEATRGSRFWQNTDFTYLNTPGGKARRLLRVWRYMGAEAPSGVIHVAGIGAQESAREVRAMLNSIRIFGGKGKEIRNADGTVRIVGGNLRKEELLTEYVNSVSRAGIEGQDDAVRALEKIEDIIQQELELFYGIEKNKLAPVLAKINETRAQLKKDIIERGYWVEKDGDQLITHKSPYLESQLQGSVIAANWRALETSILRSDKRTGYLFNAAEKWGAGGYDFFQDLWRPAVLLRLGYTQRNVAEGLFRSSAFQFSLAPVGLAANQLFNKSTGNVIRRAKYGRAGTRGVVEKSVVAAREGSTIEQMPKAFQKWHGKQVQSVDEQIIHNTQVMDEAVRELALESGEWKAREQSRLAARIEKLTAEKERLLDTVPAGSTRDQADAAIARIDLLLNDIDRRMTLLDSVTPLNPEALSDDLAATADNLLYFDEAIMPMLFTQREMLTNMRTSAVMFREQTLAKRRVQQGQANVTDPKTLQSTFMAYMDRGAFDPTDSYANIALANLSADATTRQTMALRMNTVQSLLRHQVQKTYVAVKPGDPGYWEGLATTLNQWKNSDVGQIIIRDIAEGVKDDDEIAAGLATFLRSTERGREIAQFVTESTQAATSKNLVEYGTRVAAASEAAVKAAIPEREAADKAKDAVREAEEVVAFAKKKLKQDQKTKPGRKALIGPNGERISDPAKYVQRRRDAYAKAEKAYNDKVEKLSVPEDLPGLGLAPVLSVEDALSYANKMVQRYRQLTADNRELQEYLFTRGSLSTPDKAPLAKFANDLNEFLGMNSRNAAGEPYSIIPVIGNAAIDLGANSLRQALQTASSKAFRVLGTVPEDNLVRAPFYGRRFKATYDKMTELALAQVPEGGTLTLNEINAIRQAAHYRALKDTKDWLYTIDRRTLLGSYGEWIFPFISASQNSVTAVGRMIWNDPRIAALMVMIWNAPSRAGLEDEEGRMHFTLPLEWVPKGLRETLGLDSMLDITFSKDQFNLIAPPTGFGGALPVPVPGPVVAVGFSEFMKNEWLGVTPAAPEIMTAMFGQEMADQMWEGFKSYMFGSEEDFVGMSTKFASYDKVLPPWLQKIVQMREGVGSSSSYTSWYDKIYQTEQLKWASGYRDEPPTPEEISGKTRNFFLLRAGLNLTAFTPPGFTSEITPVVEAAQRIYDSQPNPAVADQIVYEKFGPVIDQILSVRTTDSVAGLSATAESYRLAKNHSDLIGAVAPQLESSGTLNVIGLLSSGSKGEYDPSFSAAQQLADIPNTTRQFRELKNPVQAQIDAQISAGWSQYLKNMDVINAKLAERGLKSLRSAGAADLLDLKNQMVDRMRQDPRFQAWYGDYKDGVSARTMSSVMLINTALNDQNWRDAHKEDPIWGFGGAADQYMYGRAQTVEALESTSDPNQRKIIKQQWASMRADLAMRYPDWGTKQERYLSGDEDPDAPQIVTVSDVQPLDAESVMATRDAMQGGNFSTQYGWQ